MKGLRILADENIPGLAHFFGSFATLTTRPGRAISAADLESVDVLLVRSVTRVDSNLLADTPVRFVGTATIGTDHLDTDYLDACGIRWAAAPGCNARAVADYVLACLTLAASERGCLLTDLSVGIVGCGNVGSGLYARLAALGLYVIGNDPPRAAAGDAGFHDLEEVLERDVVCLHAPLVTRGRWPTHHLLDRTRVAGLSADQILVSAGRGAVVDNAVLRERLGQGDGGPWVALDVWENEPGIDPDLAAMVPVATPHIAGYSLEGRLRGTAMIHEALCRFLGRTADPDIGPLLPPVEPFSMQEADNRGSQPEKILIEALLRGYNPETDTRALKTTLESGAMARERAFDRLRKDYPQRREFASRSWTGVTDPEVRRLLEAAGFGAVTGNSRS